MRIGADVNCILSIFTTLTVHYTGYIYLIFRAYRILKVMKLEKTYLDQLYEMADSPRMTEA